MQRRCETSPLRQHCHPSAGASTWCASSLHLPQPGGAVAGAAGIAHLIHSVHQDAGILARCPISSPHKVQHSQGAVVLVEPAEGGGRQTHGGAQQRLVDGVVGHYQGRAASWAGRLQDGPPSQ